MARGSLALVLTTLGVGLMVLLCLALVLPQAIRPARSAPLSPAAQPEAPPVAGLFFQSGRDDALFEAPLQSSDVRIDVSGEIARVTLRQRFRNPAPVWLEGIYVFPLPDRSAVDRLVMTLGERRIEGKIMERAEARRVYDAAAAQGQRASLLDSERPNVFVTSVANVGPGDEIVVEIQYQDQVAYADGAYSLRFPMVVAPRYTPLPAVPGVRAPQPQTTGPTGGPRVQPIAAAVTEAEPERGRDSFGPVRHPDEGLANPLSLVVRLDTGFAPEAIESLYHPVEIEALDERRRVVTLAEGSVPADRDFVLEWRPAIGAAPEASVFAEEIDGDSYLLVSLLPPQGTAAGAVPPRDLIFVVDTSGSMHGPSMDQAKTALLTALDRLRPEDRFNVIRFSDTTSALFGGLQPADNRNLLSAAAFVGALEADGGTEMLSALQRALAEPAGADPTNGARLRQVVFLTDGAVGNEPALFEVIARELGGSRLFTIGIGSAPNSYFMREAAVLGRGSFTHIGDVGEVATRMEALFRKLERPRLTDLEAGFPVDLARQVEAYPSPLPDLYDGEPVSFTARLPGVPLSALQGRLQLDGANGATAWQRSLSLDHLRSAPGVAALWARAKLAQIETGLYQGRAPDAVRQDSLAVALKHRLVTRYTSLVAVDDEVVRPRDEQLQSGEIARNLPQGWDHEAVFGEAAKAMPLRAATPVLQRAAAGQPIGLPQTATPATLKALAGLGLLCLALALLLTVRRTQRRLERAGA